MSWIIRFTLIGCIFGVWIAKESEIRGAVKGARLAEQGLCVKQISVEQGMCVKRISEAEKIRNNATLEFIAKANEAAAKIGDPGDYDTCMICKRSHSCQDRKAILKGDIKCEDFKRSPPS